MAEITYTGRGGRSNAGPSPGPHGLPGHASPSPPAPNPGDTASRPRAGSGSGQARPRPQSAGAGPRLRTSGSPRLHRDPPGGAAPSPPPRPRQWGRVSLFDRGNPEPHEVPGPVILRDLEPPRMGFPTRPPEDFLKSGQGLDLGQRNRLRAHLRKFPVNTEPPFVPGTGGIVLSPGPPAGRRRPASATAASSASLFACTRQPLPASLLRIYYDNGTLDFVAVRWRGSRADSLVWARAVTKGQDSSAHQRDYTAWSPELPSELDVATWLPVFLDGIREYDEPYRFLAVRGSEELLYKAGDTIHTFAESLVLPLKLALDTREPTAVAVALQLMGAALALDPGVAGRWVPAYWQFAQVLNLFRARGGALAVDMGYNRRTVATCRQLATDFMTAFELAGGPAATAAVRRYSPSFDPAVTDSSMARAAAKAAVKAQEAGLPAGGFRPFTLF